MECNKDEAIRARELAEMKMKNNDFEGAQKILLKAQSLHPELENISQLISICDVHCSAKKSMLGSEKDWYGVLKVEKFADEMAIKKQYRRLALYLHPDKNRFPGAEAAFKLICEANAVLSDPQKKCLYDTKIKVVFRSAPVVPPPHHINKASQFNQQCGAEVKVSNGFHSMNQHQATHSSFSARQDMLRISCPFCRSNYQLDRKFINTTVRCRKCSKNFTSYEMNAQGVPLASEKVPVKPSMSQYSGVLRNSIPKQSGNKMGVQNGNGFPASGLGSHWCAHRPTAPPGSGIRIESVFKDKGVGSAPNFRGDLNVKRKDREGRERKIKKKGRRKDLGESSESFETSSESDPEDVIVENYSVPTRRSSRRRQNVSYNEGDDDDDDNDDNLPRSCDKSRGNKLSEDKGNRKNGFPTNVDFYESESKDTGPAYPEESLQDKDLDCGKETEANEEGGSMSNNGTDAVEIESDSNGNASSDSSDEGKYECEDPEFNDFDKDRDVSCFAVNQYWACYDSVDGMPRFYAKVKRVRQSPFELCITWLEADPADDPHKKWRDEGLPIGCGNFKIGETQKMSSPLMFAQQVSCEKGKRGSLIIHPRRGEVWAVFKDWDLGWSSDPERHRKYKYEVVEVVSDFDAVAGIRVCYLDKVGGFVSLFQRSRESRTESFMIRPNEVYRFSHCIRSFKMSGSEREGVPVGCFELDPSSLPPNPDNLYYPGKTETGTPSMESAQGNTVEFVDLETSDTIL